MSHRKDMGENRRNSLKKTDMDAHTSRNVEGTRKIRRKNENMMMMMTKMTMMIMTMMKKTMTMMTMITTLFI